MSRQDRNILILGILIIVVLIVGYYFLLLSPLRQEYADRVQERSDKQAQLQQVQQEVAELEEIRRNAPEIERQLLEFSKRIPTQPEIPTLVVQVEEIAQLAGVTQVSITPGAPEPPPGGGDFQRIPVTMSFEGTYEELQDFMLRLLDLPAAVVGRGFAPGVDLDVPIAVHDAQVPSNCLTGRLRVADGRGELVADGPTGADAVRLTANGIAALYAGTSMASLTTAGVASGGSAEDHARLDAAFVGRPAYLLDYF